jgi:hypothetical protein
MTPKKAAWRKEKEEHSWLSDAQAKRVARDHAAKKRKRK